MRKRLRPIRRTKYVVSTATIKNAAEQTKCLYGRKVTAQFPPNGFEIGDSFYIREVPVEQDPFRRYVGVCAPGQSVKTALLRVYSIILQSAYNLSLDDEYKDVIDPYYTLVGYYNSIRELGGAVRLLQDDIPDRIQRIKKKYGMSRQRFLNHKVEITSRMSSYDIPKKLSQLETPYTDGNCLDTAIATNMIAVGMDVDRLGLMVVTGQPKQNSEYIQATSRIGRSYPGLVVTLYNPYRPRDLSHYENFTGYHAQLYRFVEGTTATPFSARARDRVLHALVISAIRLHYPEFASNDGAAAIDKLKVTVREMLMGARKSILITGYSLSDYFAELVDCVIQKSQEGVLVKFFVNDIESQKAFDRLCCYKGKFLRIYNYPKQEDKMSALHAKVISVNQTDTLITSANLSYHGQEGNIELGARIHSKELAKQVEDIFTSLVFKRIFVEL